MNEKIESFNYSRYVAIRFVTIVERKVGIGLCYRAHFIVHARLKILIQKIRNFAEASLDGLNVNVT